MLVERGTAKWVTVQSCNYWSKLESPKTCLIGITLGFKVPILDNEEDEQ